MQAVVSDSQLGGRIHVGFRLRNNIYFVCVGQHCIASEFIVESVETDDMFGDAVAHADDPAAHRTGQVDGTRGKLTTYITRDNRRRGA